MAEIKLPACFIQNLLVSPCTAKSQTTYGLNKLNITQSPTILSQNKVHKLKTERGEESKRRENAAILTV
jgi:hypothetical protein